MAKICDGNHSQKAYYHEHRCECGCGCKRDTLGYAYCVPCSFNCLHEKVGEAAHALSYYERFHGRGEKCQHPPDRLMFGYLCGDCNTKVCERKECE